jgi:ABC-type tungstate transport system permease subunit
MKKILCLALCAIALLAVLTGCANKTAKLLVCDDFSKSPLLKQLTEAFRTETGYSVKLVVKNRKDIEKAVAKGDFETALVVTREAAQKLSDGSYIGGAVFYDSLYLIGPKGDPASARHLGQYAVTDVLRHIALTGFPYVHPNLITPLGARNIALWLSVDAAPNLENMTVAPDAGAEMIRIANEKGAYAIVTRQDWAVFGGGAPNLSVLNAGMPGMSDQYVVLAKKPGDKAGPSQAFVQWMMGQNARAIILAYVAPDTTVPAFESNIPLL